MWSGLTIDLLAAPSPWGFFAFAPQQSFREMVSALSDPPAPIADLDEDELRGCNEYEHGALDEERTPHPSDRSR